MDASAFQVGIMCALSLEYQAVLAIFDDEYGTIRAGPDSDIIYNISLIGKQYAAAVCLPDSRTGSGAASYLVACMKGLLSLSLAPLPSWYSSWSSK
jgi:hypothetical protein